MKIGDTFFFDGNEYSIKSIDRESTEKFPSGRVDASKFIGTHDDKENPRTIQRGRPKMFEFRDVAEALGEEFTAPEVVSDVKIAEPTSSAWSDVRKAGDVFTTDSTPTPTASTIFNSATDW
jgi:hypothetical protein